jgi:ornithine carbamoyltransferase
MNMQSQTSLRGSHVRHLIDLSSLDGDTVRQLLKDASRMKSAHANGKNKPLLQGRVLGLIFEKPSLRTRVSFQAGMAQLGGEAIFLTQLESGLGNRESLPDIARTLSQFVDAVVLRTFRHETVEEFARWSSCPVINGLSDYAHPCQALGDLLTMREVFGGKLEGRTVAFVGDGNNVARSLALACGKVGVHFVLSAPPGYGFDQRFLDLYRTQFDSAPVEEPDPHRAVAQADVIYTDVWASMGQEDEAEKRRQHFAAYQVNEALLARAPSHVRVMHCLPAHRGEEITDHVLDGAQSVAFEQAGNRMHAQKALLLWIMG